jgi:long-chain acyl-CoA synthetase
MNCTVIGMPHKYKQEVAVAYIVLRKGYNPNEILVNEFKHMCRNNLPRYSQPSKYEFRESLPKTKIGKIDFRALSEEEANKV